MSLNTISTASSSHPALDQGESFLTHGHSTDLELRIPATIEGPKRAEYAKGRLWVTDRRVIFLHSIDSSSTTHPSIQSLEIPYAILLGTKFNLPLLSPNNMLLSFLPDPNRQPPTLPSPGRGASLEAKFTVGEGAAHAVWKRVEGERARVEAARNRGEEEALPVYQP